MVTVDRVLLHTSDGDRIAVDPSEVYLLEADQGSTRVRQRSKTAVVDVREIGQVAELFAPYGFLRVHREWAVNLRRVALLRLREGRRDWELKMAPPVNQLVPISRDRLGELWAAFGEAPSPD